MKKPAVFLAGVGTCALAVASCSTATSPTPASQSGAPEDSAQSAPGAAASPTIDPDTALTSKNGQSGPSAQSGQDADSSVVIIVQLAEGTGRRDDPRLDQRGRGLGIPGRVRFRGARVSQRLKRLCAARAGGLARRDSLGERRPGGIPGRQQQPPVSEHPAASRRDA